MLHFLFYWLWNAALFIMQNFVKQLAFFSVANKLIIFKPPRLVYFNMSYKNKLFSHPWQLLETPSWYKVFQIWPGLICV